MRNLLRPREWRGWWVVVVLFLLIYGGRLIQTGGLPFGLDNNESFSSLVHARNLYRFDLGKSFGLTDESYADTQAGHPYIHSHQGNFPRLYAFVLYVLGARTIESQIWVHTLTVGLAAYFIAFFFLSRLTNVTFATTACAVFLSDYLLVGQWHTNTYRVWHFVFFFGALQCVRGLGGQHSRRWAVAGVITFAGLCYWEYVFATFVLFLAGCYAAALYFRQPRQLALAWGVQVAGGAIAAIILVTQLTAYMGWNNVLQDISFTLHARNSARDEQFAAKVAAFYAQHKVLFWPNYVDAARYRSTDAFFGSLFGQHFQFYTRWLTGLICAATLSWWLGLTGRRPRTVPIVNFTRWTGIRGWFHFMLLAGAVFVGTKLLPLTFSPALLLTCRLAIALTAPLVLGWVWSGRGWGFGFLRSGRVILGAVFLVAWTFGALAAAQYFDSDYDNLWLHASGLSEAWAAGVIGLSLALMLSLVVLDSDEVLGVTAARNLRRLRPVLLSTGIAYILTYGIFTGYIHSGYLDRQVPLLAFLTDLLLALALYLIAAICVWLWRRRRTLSPAVPGDQFVPSSIWFRVSMVIAVVGVAALGSSAVGWLRLQNSYATMVPAGNRGFLKKLSEPPYAGHSFVMNSYAAPAAVLTRKWAYMEPVLFRGFLSLKPGGFYLDRDNTFKWLADLEAKPEYQHPDYAMLISSGGWGGLMDAYLRSLDAASEPVTPEPLNHGLIQRSREEFSAFLHQQLVEQGRAGLDQYVILRLDWDYPAFLTALPRALAPAYRQQNSLANFHALGERWRVSIECTGQRSPQSRGPQVSVLQIATEAEKVNWATQILADRDWTISETEKKESMLICPGEPGAMFFATVIGQHFELTLREGPDQGQAAIRVNDLEAHVDLYAEKPGVRTYRFDSTQPEGRFTVLPTLTPGQHVAAETTPHGVRLKYIYAHQEQQAEENTRVYFYRQNPDGFWVIGRVIILLGRERLPVDLFAFRAANDDINREYARRHATGDSRPYWAWLADYLQTHPEQRQRPGVLKAGPNGSVQPNSLELERPENWMGPMQFSIQPGTRTKLGPEYFSNVITLPVPGEMFGAMRISAIFPANQSGQTEPLLTCSQAADASAVYVRYEDPTHIRIGIDAGNLGTKVSPPLAINFARSHVLEISHGGLYPGGEAADFAGRPASERRTFTGQVRIRLDQETVLESPMALPPVPASAVYLGRSPRKFSVLTGEKFSGQLTHLGRFWPTDLQPLAADGAGAYAGFGRLEMDVVFPARPASVSEPLLTTGLTGAGDFIYVNYLDARHVRINFDHWGVRGFVGSPVTIEPGHRYHLVVSIGSLFPPEGDILYQETAAAEAVRRQIRVAVDGQIVLDGDSECFESPQQNVRVGENLIGGSTCGPKFTGEISNPRRRWVEAPPSQP